MRLLIAGGGTGGHLFPAVAVAEAWKEKDPGHEIVFVVTPRPLDARVLQERGYPFRILKVEGLKGKGTAGIFRSLTLLPKAFGESLRILKEIRPHVVLGVGGYVTGPVVSAAWWKGIPCAVQEQNSIPGMTNRLLGRVADRIFLAFEDRKGFFPRRKIRLTGNPIRKEILQADEERPTGSGPFTLLILGGSQGAHRINQVVIAALKDLTKWKNALSFIHQTGEKDEEEVAQAYREMGFEHRVQAFISDMARVYGQARMIVARAGAMTVSEITALGKPSLLIPFPFAAHNHQEHNARYLVESGAAEMVLEKDFTPPFFIERIRSWLDGPERLIEMGRRAAALGKRKAAEEIADECLALAEKKSHRP